MKIKNLKIDGYKNLQNTELIHNSDFISIIGNNGSGKSNLLEAISIIFSNLYENKKNIPFDFTLEYEHFGSGKFVKIEKKKAKLSFYIDNSIAVSVTDYLPNKVVAIYSGDEMRFWLNCYEPFYKNFVASLTYTTTPQMLYLNKYYWDIALLCLILKAEKDQSLATKQNKNKEFLEQILSIHKVEKIAFKLNPTNKKRYHPTIIALIEILEQKKEYMLKELTDLLNNYDVVTLFAYLYIASTNKDRKIIENITILFDDGLKLEDLSEGQKKMLLIKAALEFAGQQDTLLLLDEPDAHIHVCNKNKIIEIVEEYKNNRQIIITTHSPTITDHIEENNLYMMNNGEFIEKKKQEIIGEITGGNKHAQNVILSDLEANKDILLVEGKTDVAHIALALSKLQEDNPKYRGLNFTYLPFGGASGLKLFVEEFPIKKKNSVFAFLDRDQSGFDAIKETCNFSGLKDEFNGHEINNIHINFIPKKQNYNYSDFVIEDYYPFEVYKEFYFKDVTCVNKLKNPAKSNTKIAFSEYCKNISKEKFKGFEVLFDLILKIKNTQKVENLQANNVDENTEYNLYHIAKNTFGVTATAKYNNNKEVIVLKGSEARQDCVASATTTKQIRNKLIEDQVLELNNNKYIFTQDYTFTSPSTAASIILGRPTNGWEKWKNEKGELLNKLRKSY